jgi:thiol-disulfide isomerase/thioredoxin
MLAYANRMFAVVRKLIFAIAAVSALGLCLLGEVPAEKAPEIRSSDTWINADGPMKLSSLKGKVVLIDFWAFDCDPCKETVPHIESLYEKYSGAGLVVLGVHTPRTEDEKQVPKLRDAVKRMGIRYPVVVDAKQKIWTDYRCDLWPTQFVIDRQGFIRLSHGGVGRYDDIEKAIQTALREK